MNHAQVNIRDQPPERQAARYSPSRPPTRRAISPAAATAGGNGRAARRAGRSRRSLSSAAVVEGVELLLDALSVVGALLGAVQLAGVLPGIAGRAVLA